MDIKYRKSFGHYVLDEIMGSNDAERLAIQQETEIKEKSIPPETITCGSCGKVGIIARCQFKSIFSKCEEPLCKSCAIKKDGKFFCKKHSERV